jgi:hypothetical protein
VTQNDHEARAQFRGTEFDTAKLRARDDIACDANDEQVARALVENGLDRDPGIRTADDDCEWQLRSVRLPAPALVVTHPASDLTRDESGIACLESLQCLVSRDHEDISKRFLNVIASAERPRVPNRKISKHARSVWAR